MTSAFIAFGSGFLKGVFLVEDVVDSYSLAWGERQSGVCACQDSPEFP
ncbi:MAG: hypothetical protein K6G15_06065 [Desulfovibrio sp.]|nr:hypothetical protein [Desulfovibrio sp.]